MTQRRKRMCFAVMALCGIALVADRYVFTGAATAPEQALAASSRSPVTPPASASPEPQTRQLIPELPFPRNLKPFDPMSDIRDVFTPPMPAAGADEVSEKAEALRIQAAGPGPVSSDTFVTRHHLDGVMDDEGLKIAIVDGVWVDIGQTVDGCTLTEVDGTRASFDCGDGEAVLNLADSTGRSPR